jgi:hypothetical protein
LGRLVWVDRVVDGVSGCLGLGGGGVNGCVEPCQACFCARVSVPVWRRGFAVVVVTAALLRWVLVVRVFARVRG